MKTTTKSEMSEGYYIEKSHRNSLTGYLNNHGLIHIGKHDIEFVHVDEVTEFESAEEAQVWLQAKAEYLDRMGFENTHLENGILTSEVAESDYEFMYKVIKM